MTLFANTGIPMIFMTLPLMILSIVPVIIIEYYVARKRIAAETKEQKIAGLTVGNLLSTFIGWPLAWFLLVVCEGAIPHAGEAHGIDTPLGVFMSVVVQAPWLVPYEDDLHWMIPTATVVLMVPFFFVSVYTERWILYRFWKIEPRPNIRAISWRCHFWSYTFLITVYWVFGL